MWLVWVMDDRRPLNTGEGCVWAGARSIGEEIRRSHSGGTGIKEKKARDAKATVLLVGSPSDPHWLCCVCLTSDPCQY